MQFLFIYPPQLPLYSNTHPSPPTSHSGLGYEVRTLTYVPLGYLLMLFLFKFKIRIVKFGTLKKMYYQSYFHCWQWVYIFSVFFLNEWGFNLTSVIIVLYLEVFQRFESSVGFCRVTVMHTLSMLQNKWWNLKISTIIFLVSFVFIALSKIINSSYLKILILILIY